MRFLLLFSRQGKLRLQKWFTPMSEREKKKIIRDMTTMVLARQPRSCNFLHWKDLKIIYKRWMGYFVCFLGRRTTSLVSPHRPISSHLCLLYIDWQSSHCFPQVCKLVFLLGYREPGEWAVSLGGYSSLCGAAGQILWQCIFHYVPPSFIHI